MTKQTDNKDTKTIAVTVPIREKKEYRLDNGIVLEKWQKIGEKEFQVDSQQVTEEDAERMKNGPEIVWWGVTKLPRQTPFGTEEVPFQFFIQGETLDEVAGKYEARLQESLAELEEKIKKEQEQKQNQVVPASADDLSAIEKAANQNKGGIIS